MEERIGRIKGILEQIGEKLSHIESRLNNIESNKANKWEVRGWFIILMSIVSIWSYAIIGMM